MADCAVESRPSNNPFSVNHYSDGIKTPCRQISLTKQQQDFTKYNERVVLGPKLRNASRSLTLVKNDKYELRTTTYPQVIQTIINGALEWEDDYPSKKDYLGSMVRMLMLSQIAQHVVFYILVPEGAPEDTLEFLAHCMVYEREAYTRSKETLSPIKTVPIWTVSYVFVPTKHRGSGHGKRLLKTLQEYMVSKDIPLSILYSDIGTDFYSKMQWNPIPNMEWICQIQDTDSFDLSFFPKIQENKHYIVTPVNLYTIEHVIEKDREKLSEELLDINPDGKYVFSIVPTIENLECDYLDMISKYSAKHNISLQAAALSIVCGAIVYPTTSYKEKEISYVLWSIDSTSQTLLITRLQASNQSCFEFIMKDVIKFAAMYYGMKEIVIWEQSCQSSFSHLMPSFGYHHRQSKERIPCLYHQPQNTEHPVPLWLHNELFFWF